MSIVGMTELQVTNLRHWLAGRSLRELLEVLDAVSVAAGRFEPAAEIHATRARLALEQRGDELRRSSSTPSSLSA